jgi:hypothetical protein
MQKVLLFLLAMSVSVFSNSQNPDALSGATQAVKPLGNSLFHLAVEKHLNPGVLMVTGEVKNPGIVNFSDLYKHEVFYKEVIPSDSGTINFVGAYRYSGYSLFDILNTFLVDKKNQEIFRPATDLYIIIENDNGEKVTFSWAEIFYSNILHQVIIATESAPIEPHKKQVNYPTGTAWKVVAANDLFNYRMLENPVKITVVSFDKKEYPIDRELRNAFSPTVEVFINDHQVATIDSNVREFPETEYQSVFYGMGMGYHPIPVFKGVEFFPVVKNVIPDDAALWNANGLVCFFGVDGYRVIYSYGELFNRADQVKPILAIFDKPVESGYFRIYHPGSFYADMSAKSLAEIDFYLE